MHTGAMTEGIYGIAHTFAGALFFLAYFWLRRNLGSI